MYNLYYIGHVDGSYITDSAIIILIYTAVAYIIVIVTHSVYHIM